MFDRHVELNGIRCLMAAACLALLAACTPSGNHSAAVTTPTPTPVLAAVPTNLTATAGNAQVNLAWSTSAGATSYHVKRSTTSGGPYTQVGAPSAASYSDTAVTNGTTYYYVVSALDTAGESADSAQVSAVPVAPTMTGAPAVPAGLTATAGNAQVGLSWSASSGATGYHVKRGTVSGGPYTQVGAPAAAAYTDTSLNNGTTYFYVVSAFNAGGESANSAQVSAMPVAPTPPPPTTGTWINVTPAGVDLTNALDCANYGTTNVQSDPMNPSNLYTLFYCQGIWKSTDYGATWTGPINTGMNGATVGDCAGGVTISPTSKATVPTIYTACIRGAGIGFWKSVDGGVNWTKYLVAPSGVGRQDYFPPVVDPYDQNHLLMTGHEQEFAVESVDGGQNWTNVPLNSAMLQPGSNWGLYFIDTGTASSTRGTWLWMAAPAGGAFGTWRTTNSGATWVQVDKNEHSYGGQQIYQPDSNGVLYMTGSGSTLGSGVLRSTDYGQTWAHVGMGNIETSVIGTSKNVYAMYGFPASDPAFEVASQPGTGTWIAPGTPAGMVAGAAQLAVVNDGTHNILVGAMWEAGIWRYVEP